MLKETSEPRHIVELDGLRALAAIAVMMSHFLGSQSFIVDRIGLPGVVCFFCLSGMLITGILLRCKQLCISQTLGKTLKQFYVRRSLRIFPLYFVAVTLFLVLVPNLRAHFWWFVLYLVNIGKTISPQNWTPLNHFWTLAVEEQFYLVWPVLVLTLSIANLRFLCLLIIVCSAAFRLTLWANEYSSTAILQLTPSCLDSLAWGAVIAIELQKSRDWSNYARIAFYGGFPVSILALTLSNWQLACAIAPAVFSIVFSSLLYLMTARSRQEHAIWRVLRFQPLTYLGTISYGLYVWHLPIQGIVRKLVETVHADWDPSSVGLFIAAPYSAVLFAISIGVASISWFFFEKPINDLKSYFPYRVNGDASKS